MIAASYWSLLAPAIEMSEGGLLPAWVPAVSGFLLGGAFLRVIDKILPHLHLGFPSDEAEGLKTNWHRSILLVLAITLHNIPEGLAIGVAFQFLHRKTPHGMPDQDWFFGELIDEFYQRINDLPES